MATIVQKRLSPLVGGGVTGVPGGTLLGSVGIWMWVMGAGAVCRRSVGCIVASERFTDLTMPLLFGLFQGSSGALTLMF